MERNSDIISVLHQGKQFTNELKKLRPVTNSQELYGSLLKKILSCYDTALAIALLGNGEKNLKSNDNSTGSEGFDSYTKDVSKKRKTTASEQVRVCIGTALGGQLDDGHSWRKYGQKNILGTTHPRAYYRCTHRSTQGCLATKLIQRTNEDPSIFEVVYKGKHSCIPETSIQMNMHSPSTEKTKEKNNEQPGGLIAKSTKEMESKEEQEFPLVFFPSIPFECETLEALCFPVAGTSGRSCSPCFLSPTTCTQTHQYYELQSSVLDMSEIISNPTLVTDFQFGELDFLTDQDGFESSTKT